jgi:two-component system chemotaxis response regulator CheB
VPQAEISTNGFHRDIIVIGASAGGVEALMQMTGRFSAMEAAIFVVLHSGPNRPSYLYNLLHRQSQEMNVASAENGMAIEHGRMYLSVPDCHLVLEPEHMRLVRGPTENRHRPSIDALFRSAAKAFGPRVIGVVLSGYLDDGSAGLHSIKRAGGLAIVQDPRDAAVPSMPENAIAATNVDYICPVTEIPDLLGRLVKQPLNRNLVSLAAHQGGNGKDELVDPKGTPSAYTCPECHGTLWEVQEGKLLRYACRVGHSFTIESMFHDQSDATERAVWAALRALEERADLSRRMEQRSLSSGLQVVANRYRQLAQAAQKNADVLRKLLLENPPAQSRERSDELANSA